MPKLQWYNSNIRCIEIRNEKADKAREEKYNSNIRCIEIKKRDKKGL